MYYSARKSQNLVLHILSLLVVVQYKKFSSGCCNFLYTDPKSVICYLFQNVLYDAHVMTKILKRNIFGS